MGLKKFIPKFIRTLLIDLRFVVKNPKLINSRRLYKFTDEELKFTHILEAFNYLKVAGHDGIIPAVFFEFGCHSGRTFSSAINSSNFLGVDDCQFFAFDSFQGLPETNSQDGYFEEGTFHTDKEEFKKIVKKNTGCELNESQLIQGFYSDTLTEDLRKSLPKVGIIHIDVDLYSSTIEVLDFIKPLLVKGSLIIFDDWYCFPGGSLAGERKAFTEFCDANPAFEYEEWKNYSTFGKSIFVKEIP
ncbi:TylF/MycF family methyltransferase [SAR86 cluster bacterium]|nr:TylF/MycF family methyltransferase [SAR86 cluster bacterium]